MIININIMPLLSWQLLPLAASCLLNQHILHASAFSPPPSWEHLRAAPELSKPPPPIYQDSLPDDANANAMQQQLPILYRDKECICAASQSVWLALECKNVEYLTVLVSKGGENADDANDIPRIEWPRGESDNDNDNNSKNDNSNSAETDPIKLLEQIQKHYPTTPPHFYPSLSSAVDASRCNILRFPGVMPRNSDPRFMSLAPYIVKADGTLVVKSSHKVSLEEIEEMQEEYYLGDYLCGREVTAADMVWAPNLERYAIQLPLIFPNVKACNPRSNVYGEVAAWYTTMETKLPSYACRVQGDARHWRKCLEKVITVHNERAASEEEKVMNLPITANEHFGWWMRKNPNGETLWKEYATAELRPWLGDTPSAEVALYLMRNHQDIVAAAAASFDMSVEESDEALREVIQVLIDSKTNNTSESDDDDAVGGSTSSAEELSENARQMAKFASERIEVPRDLGMIPALALGELVESLQ